MELTPKQVVRELDRYIIGQDEAKRAVAVALRNRYRRAHGWYNSTITDRGYHQIAALAKRFADTKFDAVYSSDRFRTMITALAIYKTHGLPLRTVRALREIDPMDYRSIEFR